VVGYKMLNTPSGTEKRARPLRPRAVLSGNAKSGLLPVALLLVGLLFIGIAIGFVIAQRSFAARAYRSHGSRFDAPDTSTLLMSVDATRDAQAVQIAQLSADLDAARQKLAAAPDRPPLALILDAPLLKQEHSLSCESSAAVMAARFHGLPVDEGDILHALPRHENPHLGFRGNVDGPYGGIDDYGVYAEPIRQVLTDLGLQVEHLSGGINEIKEHIRQERPVIAWVTYRMQVQSPRQVTLNSGAGGYGSAVTLVPYEHAVLVVGYNAEGLWVHDPYDGTRTWYGEADFGRSFGYLDNMALVVGRPSEQR
jgi:uncharacterized protein YvpB